MAAKKESLSSLEYVLAWGSFIPVLGLFLGLAAVVVGAMKLKMGGHRIILIALFGAVIGSMASVLFVRQVMWPFFSKSVRGMGVYQAMSKNYLKETVMALEYYKLVHGNYPASLDLLKGEGTSYLHDVSMGISMKTVNQNHFYELQADGQHYRLFDVGPDGLTGTADDITPLLSAEELARTGYIQPLR